MRDLHEDGPKTLFATLLALIVSGLLWIGLVMILRWIATLSPEVVMKTAAATLLLGGSWLVIRACAELDR